MTYLLQIQTSDTGLQLKTEIHENSIYELKVKAVRMVKEFKKRVSGKQYSIWSVEMINGHAKYRLLKKDIIS